MNTADLYRNTDNGTETRGSFTGNSQTGQYKCLTLERPWLNNDPDVSCIPPGVYQCIWNLSPHLTILAGHNVFTYELQNVPNRSGIRIHPANKVSQLEGCVAPGLSYGELPGDTEPDILSSTVAFDAIHDLFGGEPFMLTVHAVGETV
jgi:hypothetical protein